MLEEILQEIEATEYPVPAVTEAHLVASLGFGMAKEMIAGIIRSHMEDDGWIPCEEGLPCVEINEKVKLGWFSDNGKRFLITDVDGHVYESTFYAVARKFDDDAVAWQPLPAPYRPKQKAIGGDYKQRIMDRFMKVE